MNSLGPALKHLFCVRCPVCCYLLYLC